MSFKVVTRPASLNVANPRHNSQLQRSCFAPRLPARINCCTANKLIRCAAFPRPSAFAWHTSHPGLRPRNSTNHDVLRKRNARARVAQTEVETVVETETRAQTVTSSQGNADYDSIPALWSWLAAEHGDLTAVTDPHRKPKVELTYRELEQQMSSFAAGLQQLGVADGDVVSLFSENSARWIVADQAIMMVGAADAVRGATAPADELLYILHQSGSNVLVVQDEQTLNKLLPEMKEEHVSALKAVVVLWGEPPSETAALQCPVLSFEDVVARGEQAQVEGLYQPVPSHPDKLATLVYTSGTTGHPKGVMLTHGNLLYQVRSFPSVLKVLPGDAVLSLLPPWHIYERAVAYYLLSCASKVTYTNIRKFKDDVTRYPPDHFVCVPLVLDALHHKVMLKLNSEAAVRRTIIGAFLFISGLYVQSKRIVEGKAIQHALKPVPTILGLWAAFLATVLKPIHELATKVVYSKIRAALGIRQHVISGGGSLSTHLDEFFEIIGLTVLNGWGLTETSPVLAVRRPHANVRGSVGIALAGTELKIVDPETYQEVPDGEKGLVLARGPGVMRGYHKDDASTAAAFPIRDGWFNTGDLGWRAPGGVQGSNMAGHIVLTGRAKDTIVLNSGKNVEPQPIEDAISSSPYVKHAIVLGQDKRELGALIFPINETLEELKVTGEELDALLASQLQAINKARVDYHPYEQITRVKVLPGKALSVDDGTLTRSMKPRRPVILKKYQKEVEQLEKQLRG